MSEIRITEDCIIYNDMPRGWTRGKGQPKWHESLYKRWVAMWQRCRNPASKDYSNYKDCKIDERYRKFSNYVSDIMKLENFDKLCENPSKYHIDKDRVDPNNRCYYFEHLTIMTSSENPRESALRNGYSQLHSTDARFKSGQSRKKAIKGISITDNSTIFFNNVNESENLGFNPGHISECCRGKRNTHGGYKWQYVEESE